MPSASHFHQYTSSETIKVIVGTPPNRKRHNLYIALLRDKSAFFASKITTLLSHQTRTQARPHDDPDTIFIPSDDEANNDDLDTEPEHVIHLPTLNANAFQQFVQWLYAKPLDVSDLSLVSATYLLGHTISCEEFRNDLVDALRKRFAGVPLGKVDIGVLIRLGESLPPSAPGPPPVEGGGRGSGGGRRGMGMGSTAENGNGTGNDNIHRNGDSGGSGHRNSNTSTNTFGRSTTNASANTTNHNTRTSTNNPDPDNNGSNTDTSNSTDPIPPPIPKQNRLLEFLTAQLTYKILVRGYDNYKDSSTFKTLLASSVEIVMWHLEWIHRLQNPDSLENLRWRSGNSRTVKRELGQDEGKDEEDVAFTNGGGRQARTVKGGERKRVKLGNEGLEPMLVNPASIAGCMFHEHKEKGGLCRTPEGVGDD